MEEVLSEAVEFVFGIVTGVVHEGLVEMIHSSSRGYTLDNSSCFVALFEAAAEEIGPISSSATSMGPGILADSLT